MIDKVKIEGQLSNLRDYLSKLYDIAKIDLKTFQHDILYKAAAERLLQVSIETCLNIGNHIIASMSWRNPNDYADIFKILGENDVIPKEFSEKMVEMAKFRNLLVHLYWEIDPKVEFEFLKSDLNDFELFAKYIVKFLKKSL